VIQAIVSVLDPVSGKSLAEEKDYKASETTFSAAFLDVRTPSGGLTGRAFGMRLSGQFSRIQLDLMLAQQGPLLANLGTGLLPFYGDINYEYALPNMKTAGSVVVDGKRYQVDGVSWFDRQWGQMAPSFWAHKQWSWMGIRLVREKIFAVMRVATPLLSLGPAKLARNSLLSEPAVFRTQSTD
jgi:hypothetical protein